MLSVAPTDKLLTAYCVRSRQRVRLRCIVFSRYTVNSNSSLAERCPFSIDIVVVSYGIFLAYCVDLIDACHVFGCWTPTGKGMVLFAHTDILIRHLNYLTIFILLRIDLVRKRFICIELNIVASYAFSNIISRNSYIVSKFHIINKTRCTCIGKEDTEILICVTCQVCW